MQKQNSISDFPYAALIERARDAHLLDGLECPVVLGLYKDGNPAVFDLMKEGSLITSGGCFEMESSSVLPLDRVLLTNLFLKTDTRFFIVDDIWRDSAEFFEMLDQVPSTFPGPSDNAVCLLTVIRHGLKRKMGEDYLKKTPPSEMGTFPSVLTVYDLNGMSELGGFVHLSHLAEDGVGINTAVSLSVREDELNGIINDAGIDLFPWRMLRPLEDKDLMEKFIPGSSSFSPDSNETFLVKSSKGVEEINLLDDISDFSFIVDGNRGFRRS